MNRSSVNATAIGVLLAIGSAVMNGCASSSAVATRATSAGNASPTGIDESTNDLSNDLGIMETRVGTGARAASHQCAYVHFVGLLASGRQFDSTRDPLPNGQPQTPVAFELGARRVMPGWEQGVAGMQVGGLRRLWVPYRLAYGAGGRPPAIPPRMDLVFDIELVAVAAPLTSSNTAPRAEGSPTCPAWSSR